MKYIDMWPKCLVSYWADISPIMYAFVSLIKMGDLFVGLSEYQLIVRDV